MRLLFFVSAALCLFSCTRGDQPKNHLKISVELKIHNSDVLQLFYSRNYFYEYDEQKSILKPVIGGSKHQVVDFDIAEIPRRVRLDLGSDSLQPPIHIRRIIISMKGKAKSFSGEEIGNFFEFNKFIRFESDGTAMLFSEKKKYDPYLISRNLGPLVKELNEE